MESLFPLVKINNWRQIYCEQISQLQFSITIKWSYIQMWLNKLYLPGYQLIRHFSHLFTIFWPKIIFSCKTAYAIFKVVYQASHIPKIIKIYGLVAKKCSKIHIFHTFFAIFGQKNLFFKNPASSVFWNHRKLPWCQKSEKTMEWFERNPSGRTHGRTHGRTRAKL